jgi:TatD DNase family protein
MVMIDVHCHLEQKDYENDRDEVIERCKKELKAVITTCARPDDFDLTMEMVDKHKNFIFATCGIHPEYVKEIPQNRVDSFFDMIEENKNKIVAIGETGLDFHWTKEDEWRKKQKELFIQHIQLAKKLNKPLIIHSRGVFDETIVVLEEQDAKNVLLHMWGEKKLLERINDRNWFISVNNIVLRSKMYRSVVKKFSLERTLLETDAPWLSPKKIIQGIDTRNDPLSIKSVANKISELKKVPFDEVWQRCAQNAVSFFGLPITV